MKYLEEVVAGSCFEFENKFYLLTQDFKKNGQRLCLKLDDGCFRWLQSDSMVGITDLFTMDKDSNIIAIKERNKENVST